jgi:hypothetical protein
MDEQGFYYTFASIVSFQVMFELGLGLVVLQFASHEKAFLQWQSDGTLGGATSRKAVWPRSFASRCGGTPPPPRSPSSLLIGGTVFFAFKPTTVKSWESPWIALAILAGVTLLLTPFLSMLEGCGRVADVARTRTWQAIASNLTAWTVLIAGGRLWASPAITGAALVVGGGWVLLTHRRFFSDLLRTPGAGISWREEVWPFQWRIAVSWISSYFMFHLFIPVLFNSDGLPRQDGWG